MIFNLKEKIFPIEKLEFFLIIVPTFLLKLKKKKKNV